MRRNPSAVEFFDPPQLIRLQPESVSEYVANVVASLRMQAQPSPAPDWRANEGKAKGLFARASGRNYSGIGASGENRTPGVMLNFCSAISRRLFA